MKWKNYLLKQIQNFFRIINFIFSNGINEKNFIHQNIKSGAVIFDIGSNVGSFINFISKNRKKTKLDIHAFEPNEKVINLSKNAIKSSLHNIYLVNAAVSSANTKNIFFESSVSSQSSLKKENINLGNIVSTNLVNVLTLDSYCEKNKIEYIDFLKIDVEGMEADVLRSAKYMLENKKIKIIKIESNQENTMKVFKILNDHQYELIGILNQKYFKNSLKLCDFYFKC
jgi:FkbM family methyltransferase